MPKGIFITLEGPDGSGKSTQVENIRAYFVSNGREVVVSREPGGTSISEKLRNIVLDNANAEMDDVTEMLIYAAARAQHVAEKIRPALERGAVVVCDRFVDSSIAYQDPEIGRARIGKDVRDRLEQQKLDFHYRVYDGYKALCDKYPERIVRIDASKTIDEIKGDIYSKLETLETL